MIMGPIDHQANYESNVWNVLDSLAKGYSVYLIMPDTCPTLWLVPPNEKYSQWDIEAKTINILVENKLVEKIQQANLPYEAIAFYQPTKEGSDLILEFEKQISSNLESGKVLVGLDFLKSKIDLRRPKES